MSGNLAKQRIIWAFVLVAVILGLGGFYHASTIKKALRKHGFVPDFRRISSETRFLKNQQNVHFLLRACTVSSGINFTISGRKLICSIFVSYYALIPIPKVVIFSDKLQELVLSPFSAPPAHCVRRPSAMRQNAPSCLRHPYKTSALRGGGGLAQKKMQ